MEEEKVVCGEVFFLDKLIKLLVRLIGNRVVLIVLVLAYVVVVKVVAASVFLPEFGNLTKWFIAQTIRGPTVFTSVICDMKRMREID